MVTKIKNLLKRLYLKALYEEDILSTAATVAFYFSFALFPLLLFLVSLFGLILENADEFRSELFYYMRQIMPVSAYELVQSTVKEVLENSSGGKLTIGLLIALWSASAGIDSLRVALNSVYNLKETRSYIKTKLLAIIITLSLTLLVTVALGLVFYGWGLLTWLLTSIGLPVPPTFFLVIIQWITVFVLLMIIFAILYNFLPIHKPFEWAWITPGAITSIVLWLLLSYAFRLYLSYFDTYDKTYGSLGAVIILMLWLYLTAIVILVGGSINAILEEMTNPESAAKAQEESAKKLEQAKTSVSPEHVEKIKADKEQIFADLEKDYSTEEKSEWKTNEAPAEQTQEAKPIVSAKKEPPSETTLPKAALPEESEKVGNSAAVGLTVAGVFGFLMGMFLRKKNDE